MKKIFLLLVLMLCLSLSACFEDKKVNTQYQVPKDYAFNEDESANAAILKDNIMSEDGAYFSAWKLNEANCGKIVEFEKLNEIDKTVQTDDYGIRDVNGYQFRIEVFKGELYAIYDLQELKYIYAMNK